MPTLQVIIGSTRPGRVGLPVGQWFYERAVEHGAFEVELVDLATVNLPFVDEPHHPRLRQYTQQHTRDWSARIAAADAFVFVTPEYNHGYSAPLKNAIDFLYHEWLHKPAGVVSYGGLAAGVRAAEQLKPVMSVLKIVATSAGVYIPTVNQFVDDQRRFNGNDSHARQATAMLDELRYWETTLRPLRAQSD